MNKKLLPSFDPDKTRFVFPPFAIDRLKFLLSTDKDTTTRGLRERLLDAVRDNGDLIVNTSELHFCARVEIDGQELVLLCAMTSSAKGKSIVIRGIVTAARFAEIKGQSNTSVIHAINKSQEATVPIGTATIAADTVLEDKVEIPPHLARLPANLEQLPRDARENVKHLLRRCAYLEARLDQLPLNLGGYDRRELKALKWVVSIADGAFAARAKEVDPTVEMPQITDYKEPSHVEGAAKRIKQLSRQIAHLRATRWKVSGPEEFAKRQKKLFTMHAEIEKLALWIAQHPAQRCTGQPTGGLKRRKLIGTAFHNLINLVVGGVKIGEQYGNDAKQLATALLTEAAQELDSTAADTVEAEEVAMA